MEKKINYLQLLLVLIVGITSFLLAIWGAWELIKFNSIKEMIATEIKAKNFIPADDAKIIIQTEVLEQREKQAEEKTGSLSWNTQRAMAAKGFKIERNQVAPMLADLAVWGLERKEEVESQKAVWDEFVKTRYICPVLIDNKLYFRYADGDYPVTEKSLGNGFYSCFWRHPQDDDKRYIPSISKVKDD